MFKTDPAIGDRGFIDDSPRNANIPIRYKSTLITGAEFQLLSAILCALTGTFH
jgi:hypothetical protein